MTQQTTQSVLSQTCEVYKSGWGHRTIQSLMSQMFFISHTHMKPCVSFWVMTTCLSPLCGGNFHTWIISRAGKVILFTQSVNETIILLGTNACCSHAFIFGCCGTREERNWQKHMGKTKQTWRRRVTLRRVYMVSIVLKFAMADRIKVICRHWKVEVQWRAVARYK